MSEPEWVRVLHEKLDDLRVQEVLAVDPDLKFKLKKSIEEAEGKLAAWAASPVPPLPRVAPTRLGQGAPVLFGRETTLADLDQLWDTNVANVVTVVAWGGVGKTALVNEWRNRLLASDSQRKPDWIYDWSFYSQGVRERGAVSADSFVRAALIHFGDPGLADSNASPWDKGARLAELVGRERVLLILDGLEPLQHPKRAGMVPGTLMEGSIEALLRGLAANNRGLCVVTTRLAVADLERCGTTLAPTIDLEHLSETAGSALLESMLGAVASSDDERREISREVKGHALTLELLGGYIRRALGDVRRWREIDFARADEEQGGHAFRVMEAYVQWFLSHGDFGRRQLSLLRLLGLFDRPADPGCIEALRRAPAIAGLTEGLVGLDGPGWRLLVSSLTEMRLLTHGEYVASRVRGHSEFAVQLLYGLGVLQKPRDWTQCDYGPDAIVLDAHPLVREYFGQEFQKANPDGWREGHRRVYEHLCGSVPYWPEGVEGLQALYQAIMHGCAAGRVQDACARVYRSRILRGSEFYSTRQLGTFNADLGAVACFFERTWDRPWIELSPSLQAWVLDVAAYCLRALGRLSDALEPMRAGLEMNVERRDWKNAAISAGNLSELRLTLGQTAAAVEDAAESVAHADRVDDGQRVGLRTTLADARHQAGDIQGSRELFEEAEAMQSQQQPRYPRLYSLPGYRYGELLLGEAERAAWQRMLGHVNLNGELVTQCTEVFSRAEQALAWDREYKRLLDIGLHHLTLGRAALYAAILEPEQSFVTAHDHIDAAVNGIRKAGTLHHLPRGLIVRAVLHHQLGHSDRARADLDEADLVATRGPMPLHQADIQLTRARLFRDREALTQARHMITKHSYNRRLPELEDAEQACSRWPLP
jgi:tetratricopeptide (TPR) repeat protein